MTEAVIEPGTKLNTLNLKGTVKQGGQSMQVTQMIDYPNAMEQTVQAPMGKVKLSYKNGSGTMMVGGQERPMPPQMAKGLKSTLNRSYLAIAMKANELNPQFLGTEEVEGTTYNKISVNVDDTNITLLLSQETNYPEIQRYKQFNPQAGEQMKVENRFSDWNTAGGIAYPYSQITFIGGNKTAEATYESHAVNDK